MPLHNGESPFTFPQGNFLGATLNSFDSLLAVTTVWRLFIFFTLGNPRICCHRNTFIMRKKSEQYQPSKLRRMTSSILLLLALSGLPSLLFAKSHSDSDYFTLTPDYDKWASIFFRFYPPLHIHHLLEHTTSSLSLLQVWDPRPSPWLSPWCHCLCQFEVYFWGEEVYK